MIYLDNAATSFPKPRQVIEEQNRCVRKYCGNPGRGSHKLAIAAAEKIFECREELASFFCVDRPESFVFTMNATMALNIAIKGLLQKGDHVLISDLEHNAVYRPIDHLAKGGMIEYDIFPSLATDPERTPDKICWELKQRIRGNTKAVICTHASNICSVTMPIKEIGEVCRQNNIYFIVDAAQSAGHLEVLPEKMGIDVLCAPGHKGLLGVQGSGFLLLGKDIRLETLLEGGSGVNSLELTMPEDSPERYEAGTLPTPAIAGLCEGIKELKRIGVETVFGKEHEMTKMLEERLLTLPGIKVHARGVYGSVLSFSSKDFSADCIGEELDRRGICVRSGYHCAGLAHHTLQTPLGGTVRVSPGVFNRKTDMDTFYKAMKDILFQA